MAKFEPCFEKTMALEGGYVLHDIPGDRGGLTYAGIARNRWPHWHGWSVIDRGEAESSTELTGLVREFYRVNFWNKIKGDEITDQDVAACLYDFAVNAGVKIASKLAQRLSGVSPDGVIGAKTIEAINTATSSKPMAATFVSNYSLLRLFRYKNIAFRDKRRRGDRIQSNLKFLCGWINRVEKSL